MAATGDHSSIVLGDYFLWTGAQRREQIIRRLRKYASNSKEPKRTMAATALEWVLLADAECRLDGTVAGGTGKPPWRRLR